jgi:hypothetical protein
MIVASLALVLAVVPTAPKKIAIMDVRADGGADPVIGSQLTARIAEVVGRRTGTSVIAPDDLRALLEQETRKQLVGCTDDGCLAEIAGALGVDALVSGRISKIEKGFAFSMSLIEAKEARALGHASEVWGGESIALLDLVAPMVDILFSEKSAVLNGAIDVQGAISGSRIIVDDQVRGTAPAGQMGGIRIGARRVQVLDDDHQPFERWIVVKKDETAIVAVEQLALESSPIYARWWFWTIAAAGVAGVVVGSAFALKGGESGGGETGVSVTANADSAFTGGF